MLDWDIEREQHLTKLEYNCFDNIWFYKIIL